MDELDPSDDHLRGIIAISRNRLKVGINIDSPAQCLMRFALGTGSPTSVYLGRVGRSLCSHLILLPMLEKEQEKQGGRSS